jgi:hypothetical protein
MDKIINAHHAFVKKQRFGDIYFIMMKDNPRCNEANKLILIAIMSEFWILSWIRSSIPAIPLKIKIWTGYIIGRKKSFCPTT